MRKFLKIVKWSFAGIVLIALLLFGASLYLQNNIVTIFLNSINETIPTKIEVGKSSLSLIKRFPNASVKLENVYIHSSPGFDRTQFPEINTDSLISAKSITLEFKMTDIIKGIYNIESISINNGRVILLSDSSGGINYEFYKGTSQSADTGFAVNLEKISISELNTTYINRATGYSGSGLIKTGRFKSRISGNNFDLTALSSILLSKADIFPVLVKTPVFASIDLNMHMSDSGIFFRKGVLKVDNFSFGITGKIAKDDNLNLIITGRNIEISKLKKFLPEKYASTFTEYNPMGLLSIDCALTGRVDRMNNPLISINFSLEKGAANYQKSLIRLKKVSLSGKFTNGNGKRPETSSLIIDKANASLGSAEYSASGSVRNFTSPRIDMKVSGEIFLSEIIEFFGIENITLPEGSVIFNLKLGGKFPLKEKYTFSDFLKLRPEADMRFKSLGFELKKDNIALKKIKGDMKMARNVSTDGLSFLYNGLAVSIDGDFTNIPAWLAGQSVYIKAVGNISLGDLDLCKFIPDSGTAAGNDKSIRLPVKTDLDINLSIDNLVYKKFSASRIKAKLLYKPGVLNLRSFSIDAIDGHISGDCSLSQTKGESYISRGNFDFYGIDIHKAFISFNNFGQDFIKAENLEGSMAGQLSLRIPLDSMLNPVSAGVSAEGKYSITDGTLKNFEPVKSLSDFIAITELENISFSKLENDFYIKNRYIATPQMDIRSSAADFSISGKHGFDDDYEYHVKMYLSQLLSKKIKKHKSNSSEFGAVEDDGLGRTSVFLKITGIDENIKVAYDLKAAGGKIKNNLKSEKESLKTILNKEYGWYKKDSTLKQESAPKPKFRIEWEETDSVRVQADTSSSGKAKGINNIFKKKKGAEILFQ